MNQNLFRAFPRCLALCLFFPVNLLAHHASAPHYDNSQTVVVDNAVITEFKMVNPHSFVYFDAPNENGEIQNWRCELRPASILRRRSWTEQTFATGQQVSVEGNPAWREDNSCLLRKVVFADGTEIEPNTDFGAASEQSPVATDDNNFKDRSVPRANGQPDISGDWVSLSFTRNGLGGGSRLENNGFDPSDANIAAAKTYDVRYDDPALRCHPINIIQGLNHDSNVNRITQLDDRIVLTYGFVDFARTIFLDAEHPEDLEPSIGGHSIGNWEDDVLVVDTVGFSPGVLSHRIGILHSDQMRITERIYVDEASGELVRDYQVEDPLFLNSPYINQDRQKVSAEPYSSYDCEDLSGENNRRPTN